MAGTAAGISVEEAGQRIVARFAAGWRRLHRRRGPGRRRGAVQLRLRHRLGHQGLEVVARIDLEATVVILVVAGQFHLRQDVLHAVHAGGRDLVLERLDGYGRRRHGRRRSRRQEVDVPEAR